MNLSLLFCLCILSSSAKTIADNYRIHISETRDLLRNALHDAVDVRLIHHGHIDGTGTANIC